MKQINCLDNNRLTIIWIPSHVDLIGNDRADNLAKEALDLDRINSTNYLELEEMYSLIKPFIINKWQIQYDLEKKGKMYKTICPTVNNNLKFIDPDRQKEVQIGRLRLGVANTNKKLYIMGKHPTGFCDSCQTAGDIEHLLLACNQNNIATVLKNACNMYKLEFNLKSVLDVGCIQGTVYRLVKELNNGKML